MNDLSEITLRPVWRIEDFCRIIDLPVSTLALELKKTPAPIFIMGRRRYILQADALEWLKEVAVRNLHTPRINRRGGAK